MGDGRGIACGSGCCCSCGNTVDAGFTDLWCFHVTDLRGRADRDFREEQSVKDWTDRISHLATGSDGQIRSIDLQSIKGSDGTYEASDIF